MSAHSLLRPAKRRRTKQNDNILYEDDVGALDTVTVERISIQTKKGPVETEKYVPIPKANDVGDGDNLKRTGQDDIFERMEDIDINMYRNDEYQEGTADELGTAAPSDTNKARLHPV
jgi:hypothetical protein